jgi:replication factor A1
MMVLPIVKIAEIQPEMRNIDIVGSIVEKGETREVITRYGPAQVSWATLKDETGSIRVNLWRGQVKAVNAGDRVQILNAFVKVFGDRIELNIGADGKIAKLSSGGDLS